MGGDCRGTRQRDLEVLDPAQNPHFRDHYLDIPIVSNVLFIAPRTSSRRFPARCSIAWRSSSFAATPRTRRPASRARCGPRPEHDDRRRRAARVIPEYTREAGVRELERRIGDLRARSPRGRRRRPHPADMTDTDLPASDRALPADPRGRPPRRRDRADVAVGGDVRRASPGEGMLTITGSSAT